MLSGRLWWQHVYVIYVIYMIYVIYVIYVIYEHYDPGPMCSTVSHHGRFHMHMSLLPSNSNVLSLKSIKAVWTSFWYLRTESRQSTCEPQRVDTVWRRRLITSGFKVLVVNLHGPVSNAEERCCNHCVVNISQRSFSSKSAECARELRLTLDSKESAFWTLCALSALVAAL